MKNRTKALFLGTVLALVLGGAVFTACSGEHEHVYNSGSWTVVKAAECEANGLRTRKCTVCGYVDEEVIPALDHQYDSAHSTVTKAATCEEPGEITKTCTRCGKPTTEPVSPLNHDWNAGEVLSRSTCTQQGKIRLTCQRSTCGKQEERDLPLESHRYEETDRKDATCTEEGYISYQCTECSDEMTETVKAYGHRWIAAAGNKEPTCTEAGYRDRTCSVCGTSEKQVVDALKHLADGVEVMNKLPTFDTDGEKSQHCIRCGEPLETVVVPKLQAGVPVEVSLRTVRNNGNILSDPNITVTVYEGDSEVARSSATTLKDGVFKVMLDPGSKTSPKTYTVKVTNLPTGYTAQTSYTVSPADPYCDLWLTAAPIAGSAPRGTLYKVGSVMYDVTFPGTLNTTDAPITLSDLLKTKKIVVLNFWATWCSPCQQEFPYLQSAYANRNKSDYEILAIDSSSEDSAQAVRQFAAEYGLSFPMAFDLTSGLQAMFGISNIPTTVILDSEGVVCAIHTGSFTSVEAFNTFIAPYLSDGYWKAPAANAANAISAIPAQEAILPEKREER